MPAAPSSVARLVIVIAWAVSFEPPYAGRNVASIPAYEDPVFELWLTYTLQSGLVIIAQHMVTHQGNGIMLWDQVLPSSVLVDVFPNFELTLEWLVGI